MNKAARPTDEEVRARFRVACICMGIKAGKISDAIKAGARTAEEVNRATGSGAGDCGATRCRPVIEAMLRNGGRLPVEPEPAASAERDDDFWCPAPVLKRSGG